MILQRWSAGEEPTTEELQALLARELADPQRAIAFDLTAENGLEQLVVRSRLFQTVYAEVVQLCQGFGFRDLQQILQLLWTLWLPLAMHLVAVRKQLRRPLIQGILGVQGTGKSTLAAVLSLIIEQLGHPTLSFSLDDLYKSYRERQQLQLQDPRLLWRGPPGTHDLQMGVELLEQVRHRPPEQPLWVPRFDKSAWNGAGDQTTPERVNSVDIVLFEGWFVGVRPIAESAFETAPPPIVTPSDRAFARDTNERLRDYLSLWQRLDRLLVLYPLDYRSSQQWRKEAEQKMRAAGKSGMTDEEIDRFVEYFWKALHPALFLPPLIQNPTLVDLTIEINRDRQPGKVYRPIAREGQSIGR
jgi:D-glycerate 3-kinase